MKSKTVDKIYDILMSLIMIVVLAAAWISLYPEHGMAISAITMALVFAVIPQLRSARHWNEATQEARIRQVFQEELEKEPGRAKAVLAKHIAAALRELEVNKLFKRVETVAEGVNQSTKEVHAALDTWWAREMGGGDMKRVLEDSPDDEK